MGEGETFLEDQSRFGQIRGAAESAKRVGLGQRGRREVVIRTIASESILGESEETRAAAINKYGDFGVGEKPALMDVPHAVEMNLESVAVVLREYDPDLSLDKIRDTYDEYLSRHGNGQEDLGENDSAKLGRMVALVRDAYEPYTGEMSRTIAESSNSCWAIAKRGRMDADVNRRTFFDKPRGVDVDGGDLLQTIEHPTSVRAAQYWMVENVLSHGGWLDIQGKLIRLFLHVTLHGMADREDGVGVVLGGGDANKQERDNFVTTKLLMWAGRQLNRFMNYDEAGEVIEPSIIVGIHRFKEKKCGIFKR